MRTTVGPLPASVYWRRRAIVLGALVLGIIVLFVNCAGNDETKPHNASVNSTLDGAAATPQDTTSFVDPPPGDGPKLPDPSSLVTQPAGNGGATVDSGNNGADPAVTAAAGADCADSEISVVPVPAATTIKRGEPVVLRLEVKNIGPRTCTRDVGADPQELYLNQGVRKYWSSDDCSTTKGHNVRQFTPGLELEYRITWNGRQSNICTSGLPAGPNPPPGQFQLRARLGTLVSNPIDLTIVS